MCPFHNLNVHPISIKILTILDFFMTCLGETYANARDACNFSKYLYPNLMDFLNENRV